MIASLSAPPIALIAAFALGFVLVAYLRGWAWTGFIGSSPAGRDDAEGRSKTLWDWMHLLIIPGGLAIGLFALNAAESRRDRARQETRANLERSIAADDRREVALAAYLQDMSELILQRKLLPHQRESPALVIAQTMTLTVLRRLDGVRKGLALQFLSDSGLLASGGAGFSLKGADLRGVVVRGDLGTLLERTYIREADLRDADFRKATLTKVSFVIVDLRGADFRNTHFDDPAFETAELVEADFRHAQIFGALYRDSDLRRANFTKAAFVGFPTLAGNCLTRTSFTNAQIHNARFSGSEGRNVDFTGAILSSVDFRRARLDTIGLRETRAGRSRLVAFSHGRPRRYPSKSHAGPCNRGFLEKTPLIP